MGAAVAVRTPRADCMLMMSVPSAMFCRCPPSRWTVCATLCAKGMAASKPTRASSATSWTPRACHCGTQWTKTHAASLGTLQVSDCVQQHCSTLAYFSADHTSRIFVHTMPYLTIQPIPSHPECPILLSLSTLFQVNRVPYPTIQSIPSHQLGAVSHTVT